jgi:Zn-dependent peptidase ImmA (M78 family)
MSISSERKNQIESIAGTALQNVYPDGKIVLPVDLNKIIQHYDLKLTSADFGDDKIAGAFQRSAHTIYVSNKDPYTRAAFTIAHELGHFLLHADKDDEIFFRLDADLIEPIKQDKEETEANWFAASLLMPRELVYQYWDILHDEDRMAKLFGVSKSAMYWRLKNLALIEE